MMNTPMRVSRAIALLCMLVMMSGISSSHAAVQIVVAPPGSQISGLFDSPVNAAVKALPLQFVNLDAISTQHNVKSEAYGPDSAPWCNRFPAGRCPLFVSALVNAGGTSTADLRNTVVGQSYPFYCQLHGNMKGVLYVEA